MDETKRSGGGREQAARLGPRAELRMDRSRGDRHLISALERSQQSIDVEVYLCFEAPISRFEACS